MTGGALLLTVAGLLVAAGIVGAVAAIRGVRLFPRRARTTTTSRGLRSELTGLHLAAVAAGVLVLVVTGWPVAALGVAAGVVYVPSVLGRGRAAKELIEKSEALADWTRRLADLISSGAAGSTREALKRSLTSVPETIAPQVALLVSRMGPQGTESALLRFAAEVGDPSAQKIAGILILRERNGGPGLADVLTALAADLDDRSRMIREVEAERAKPRTNMRSIVVATAVLVSLMMLFARPFLSTYSSVIGQITLAGVVAVFAIALRWMKKLSTPPTQSQVLVAPSEVRW